MLFEFSSQLREAFDDSCCVHRYNRPLSHTCEIDLKSKIDYGDLKTFRDPALCGQQPKSADTYAAFLFEHRAHQQILARMMFLNE